MAGPTQNLKEGWTLLRQAIEIEPEVDSGLYLGCEIHYGSEKMSDGHEVRTVIFRTACVRWVLTVVRQAQAG